MMSVKSTSWSRPSCATARTAWPLKQQAVLFRTSHHSAMLEIELARRNIPFVKFGGLKFVEAAHVKDVLAVLRWAENPTDRVTGFRVVQMLDGIGPATAGRVLDHIAAHTDGNALATFRPPTQAATAWQALVALMTTLRDESVGMAGAVRAGAAVVSAASGAALRRCRVACRRPGSAAAHRRDLPLAHAVPDRSDA